MMPRTEEREEHASRLRPTALPLAVVAVVALGAAAVIAPLMQPSRPSDAAPITAIPAGSTTPASSSPRIEIVGGWRWHRLTLVPTGPVMKLPNGYLASCGRSLCTSADGWDWHLGADPNIFSADVAADFLPEQYARDTKGRYVITNWADVLYSTDGVHFQRSSAPAAISGSQDGLQLYVGLAGGPAGFTLIGMGFWQGGNHCRIYTSTDANTWQEGELLNVLGIQSTGEPSGGFLVDQWKTGKGFLYSKDGRTWASAKVPAGSNPRAMPVRLSDGSLLDLSDVDLLRSTDGRTWTKLSIGWEPDALAIAGGVPVVTASKGGSGPSVLESNDSGRTWRVVTAAYGTLEQFGDMVEVGGWAGVPLTPAERAAITPTATGLPTPPPYVAPTPRPTPAGGISRDDAIQIARDAAQPRSEYTSLAAMATFDDRLGRWIWTVDFFEGTSPTGQQGTLVEIDYFTGKILSVGDWIS